MNARGRFIVRRLLLAVPVLLAMSAFVFLMIHLVPGDPVRTMLGFRATPANVAQVRQALGLDQPLLAQYTQWLGGILHGDLGQDFISHTPVATLLAQRLPVTIELTVLSMTLAIAVGVPLGVRAATKPGWIRRATEGFVIAGIAIPDFWLGIMLVLLFAGIMQVLPPSGYVPFLQDPAQNLRYMALPVITLAFGEAAYILRTTRGAMEATLGTPFVLFARARGLSETSIVFRHTLRNASVPIVTVIGHPVRRAARRGDRHRVPVRPAGDRPAGGDRRSTSATTRSSRAASWSWRPCSSW